MVDDHPQPPTRDDVAQKLRDLAAGKKSPEEVSDWAQPWVYDDDLPEVEDELVWDTLDKLTAADTQSQPGAYMFTTTDFHAWQEEFEAARRSQR